MTSPQARYIVANVQPGYQVAVNELGGGPVELTIQSPGNPSHESVVTLDANGNITDGPTRQEIS